MGNKGQIYRDDCSVGISAAVHIPLYLKVILIAFLAATMVFMLFMLWPANGSSFKDVSVFICLFGAFQVFIGRLIFWNIFGKESITITRKSISYFRSYGLFTMPVKVIPFRFLATEIEVVREEEAKEFGILNFYDRVETNLQLKRIFSTAVYLPVEQLKEFEGRLICLFRQQGTDTGQWLSYSLN